MSLKWTGSNSQSETGILRKSEFKEKKEELFVFGYSCKLFRDDAKALHIDQGKHLIPWMGDETLKIDRYDARGALHDLSNQEAPQGGFDWRVELTKSEQEVELLCDEERYRALHTDEAEELMYKEEELKRLHKAGYGQVGFNYDQPAEQSPIELSEVDEEPFIPTPVFKDLMPIDTVFPETLKHNAIIEKTSKFIAHQGAQMEILIKAKQRDNLQFNFLNKDDPLHPYYTALTALVKAGKWPEKKPEIAEEKHPDNDEYLHPSLASTIIESAPSIPSIHYKPSADCDYTMLISKMRGDGDLAPGELPPPGTEPATAPAPGTVIARPPILYNTSAPPPPPTPAQQLYQQQQYAIYYQQCMASLASQPPHSTGLTLMKSYDSGDDTNLSESEDESKTNGDTPIPPDDIKTVIEKMASYVARNGDEFADIVRAKNDPRFTFLDPSNVYHAYYNRLMQGKRGEVNGVTKKNKAPVSFSIKKLKEPDPILPKPALPYESSSDEDDDKTDKTTDKPIEKPDKTEEPSGFEETKQQPTPTMIPPILVYKMDGQLTHNLPKVKAIEPLKYLTKTVIQEHNIENVIETMETVQKVEAVQLKVDKINVKNYDVQNEFKDEDIKIETRVEREVSKGPSPVKEKSPIKERSPFKERSPLKERLPPKEKLSVKEKLPHKERSPFKARSLTKERSPFKERILEKREKDRDSPDKRRDKKRRKEYRSKSQEYKRSKSSEREKRRERDRDSDKKRRKIENDNLESEIISLEDNSDDMIDLTGDLSDSKGETDAEAEKAKQMERRRRAAEFLKKVGVDPAAAALPTSSLASAMVDTLESIRKKKAAEEEKRRRKEKRRRRERRDYDDEADKSHRKSKRRKNRSSDDDDICTEAPKKKKRKKEKKSSKPKKKRRHEPIPVEEEDQPLPPNINLSSTLKELRTNSPTKNLIIPDVETNVDSESESEGKRGEEKNEVQSVVKKKREYSEGEWSSDSEEDSYTDESRRHE